MQLAGQSDEGPCKYVLIVTRVGPAWKRLFFLEQEAGNGERFGLVWNQEKAAVGLDFGQREVRTAAATLTWSEAKGGEVKLGYVIVEKLIRQQIRWNSRAGAYEFWQSDSPEAWD